MMNSMNFIHIQIDFHRNNVYLIQETICEHGKQLNLDCHYPQSYTECSDNSFTLCLMINA